MDRAKAITIMCSTADRTNKKIAPTTVRCALLDNAHIVLLYIAQIPNKPGPRKQA